jgi:hypothetical protein
MHPKDVQMGVLLFLVSPHDIPQTGCAELTGIEAR